MREGERERGREGGGMELVSLLMHRDITHTYMMGFCAIMHRVIWGLPLPCVVLCCVVL